MLSVLVAGCSSNPLANFAPGYPPTIEPAQPAVSPPTSQDPAGAVRPLSGHPRAALFDNGTRQLVALRPGADSAAPASIMVFDDVHVAPRVIFLPGPAAALTSDDHGTAFLAARGGYFVADLSSGHTARVNVADAAHTDYHRD